MPFTFAHPAAVLPLRRFRFLLTVPLVIGSLVPDVPYYFPRRIAQLWNDTHTLDGSFFICLPLGMALLVAVVLLREPLTVLLSPRARAASLRSIEEFARRPMHWPIALLSLLIGTWTHIGWDSFTHPDGWTTMRVAALGAPISIFGWGTTMSHLLQYVSSVVGLVVVAEWIRRAVRRTPEPANAELLPSRTRHAILLMVAASTALIVGMLAWRQQWYLDSYYHLCYLLLTRSIAWFGTLYLGAGLAVMFNRRALPEAAA
ncbi:MAG TPA: DUF4184 family protein [Steroidobacteraceae bacterium]|jgi:hypothetical protein